jgi:uncharacterized protein (DUF2147 family)
MAWMILLLAAQSADTSTIKGRWSNPAQSVIMVIAPCGQALCGTVEWASDAAKADARKGTAELIGSQLLTGLTAKPNGRFQGKLFVPDKKMRVSAKIELIAPDELKVSGCALGKSLCKSQRWSRVRDE